MSVDCECPICMDVIDATKNRVVTDCGHVFHCSCLMQNAAHNGFGCPFCRTAMADEPKDDDEESTWSDVADEDENEVYDDYALRGLRFMTNNLEGIRHERQDVEAEDEDEEQFANQENANEPIAPTAAYITAKLASQGVTMEQLVKCLMIEHREYEDTNVFDELDNASMEIFGKMRMIISNYSPDTPQPAVPRPVEPVATPIPVPTIVAHTPNAPLRNPSLSAEPKTPIAIVPRRLEAEFIELY